MLKDFFTTDIPIKRDRVHLLSTTVSIFTDDLEDGIKKVSMKVIEGMEKTVKEGAVWNRKDSDNWKKKLEMIRCLEDVPNEKSLNRQS